MNDNKYLIYAYSNINSLSEYNKQMLQNKILISCEMIRKEYNTLREYRKKKYVWDTIKTYIHTQCTRVLSEFVGTTGPEFIFCQ